MRPIRPTSPWAMNPVSRASTIAHAQMNTTRASMAARSTGIRKPTSAGPAAGATGSPSAVAPCSRLKSLFIARLLHPRAAASRPLVLFEEHRRRSRFGTECIDQCGEGVGEALSLRGGNAIQSGQDLLLRHLRRALQHGPAVLGEIEDEA